MQVMEALKKAADMESGMEIRSVKEFNDHWFFTCMDPDMHGVQLDCPRIRVHKDTGEASYVLLTDKDFFDSMKAQEVILPEGVLPYSAQEQ